jgi:hypothetical protein
MIGWPQQPPTEKVLNFNMIFHESTKIKSFSKQQNSADFKNLDDSEVISSDFSGLKTSKSHHPHDLISHHSIMLELFSS